jgi:hypothetical protein
MTSENNLDLLFISSCFVGLPTGRQACLRQVEVQHVAPRESPGERNGMSPKEALRDKTKDMTRESLFDA